MKKIFAILLAVAMLASMATVASAASTTTLTTTVPAASYTLNIPADQKIDFGATKTNIGELSVTNSSGFAVGKNLNVTITYDAFKCENTTTTIPFVVSVCRSDFPSSGYSVSSGDSIAFLGQGDGSVEKYVLYKDGAAGYRAESVIIDMVSTAWGKALAGEYTATITFTAEVVAG